jgi:hypothetical protein
MLEWKEWIGHIRTTCKLKGWTIVSSTDRPGKLFYFGPGPTPITYCDSLGEAKRAVEHEVKLGENYIS